MSTPKSRSGNVTRMFNHSPSPYRLCQWPFGEPGTEEFHFCLAPTQPGYSYCPKHLEMAYREPEPRRQVA